ncbi:unnamed protein product [Schistosoma margrebowiei]|uniref:Uncharacterized protein n=1 Tax=Schistosoma margrebowiei TaxID=48269 RepID=A0A183M4B5_9TREM|nr:unnamed protein product [Schistosoma margrebowiei]
MEHYFTHQSELILIILILILLVLLLLIIIIILIIIIVIKVRFVEFVGRKLLVTTYCGREQTRSQMRKISGRRAGSG